MHPLTWVGYSSWLGHAYKFAGDHTLTSLKPSEPGAVRAYGAILTWANLAVKVFGVYESIPRHVINFDTASLKQVAPRLDRHITWPLWPAAGDGNIERMADLVPLTPIS